MNESKKLTKQSIIYLHILHAIWTLVDYYSRLFGIEPWEDPTKIPVAYIERNGMLILRFCFHSAPSSMDYTQDEIREIMQQYLDYCILPEEKILCPYRGGNTIYDTVEPLYIDKVHASDDAWLIDVIYIDNPLAYKYIQKKKWKGDMIL